MSRGRLFAVSGGILLTSVFWNYAFDWLSFHCAWFSRLTEQPPLPLIRNGRMPRRNMHHELITEDELMIELRKQGLKDVARLKEAFIESDGRISVIQNRQKHHELEERKGA